MTPQKEKVFRKYTDDLKKYLVSSFAVMTALLLGGFAIATALHGFMTVYIVFPLMWVFVLLGNLVRIPFFAKANKDMREGNTAKAKIKSPVLTFDGKNCLKVQKGAVIGKPKYTVEGDKGKVYGLYIDAVGADVKDKISFEDGLFEVEYLENCGIIVSVKAEFRGEDEDKEDFEYRIGKFLGDYIE